MISINETFLDQSREAVDLEEYVVVSGLDRRDGRQGGGIIVFAHVNVGASVTLLAHSSTHERSWLRIYTESRPHLLGCWYRPPTSGVWAV